MEECPICLETCETDVFISECCHKHFHTSCHAECMKVNASCPLCRSVVIQIEHRDTPIKYGCSKLCCFLFIFLLFSLGLLGAFIFCVIAKFDYKLSNNRTNSTG